MQKSTRLTIRRTNRYREATRTESYRVTQTINQTGNGNSVNNRYHVTQGNGSSGRRRLVIRY